MSIERDPVKEAQYEHESEQIGLLFQRLAEERRRTRGLALDDEYQERITRALVTEIESTGLCARDCMRAMADSWDSAMAAIEKAARAWEDKTDEVR